MPNSMGLTRENPSFPSEKFKNRGFVIFQRDRFLYKKWFYYENNGFGNEVNSYSYWLYFTTSAKTSSSTDFFDVK